MHQEAWKVNALYSIFERRSFHFQLCWDQVAFSALCIYASFIVVERNFGALHLENVKYVKRNVISSFLLVFQLTDPPPPEIWIFAAPNRHFGWVGIITGFWVCYCKVYRKIGQSRRRRSSSNLLCITFHANCQFVFERRRLTRSLLILQTARNSIQNYQIISNHFT